MELKVTFCRYPRLYRHFNLYGYMLLQQEDKVDVVLQNQTIPIYKEDLPDFSCQFKTNEFSATDVRKTTAHICS